MTAGLAAAAPLFTTSAVVVGAALLGPAGCGTATIKVIGVTVTLSVTADALIVRPLPT